MGNLELIAQVLCALQVGIPTNVLATSKSGDTSRPGRSGVGWRSRKLPEGPVVLSRRSMV